jgi:molecular chaperone GrpE (heat shock protein)
VAGYSRPATALRAADGDDDAAADEAATEEPVEEPAGEDADEAEALLEEAAKLRAEAADLKGEVEDDANAELKAEITALDAQLKEKRLELSRANGAAAEASQAGYYRIVADVQTYKKNADKQRESVTEVAKADAFKAFDKVLLVFDEARSAATSDEDEAKVHADFATISSALLEQFKVMGLEEFEAAAGDAYEPWRHDAVESRPSENEAALVAETLSGGYRLASTGAVVRKAKCVVDLAAEKEAAEEKAEEEDADADAEVAEEPAAEEA